MEILNETRQDNSSNYLQHKNSNTIKDPNPFFRHDIVLGLFSTASRSALMFPSERPVLIRPDFPLFRFNIVPFSLNFLLIFQMVALLSGGLSGTELQIGE